MTEEKFIILKFEDEFVDIIWEVNPEHRKNVSVENFVKVLYPQLLEYLYGCIESALLWYDLYTNNLKSHGFMVNTYDRYIESSTVYGKQCTIAWYVDNNKVSHIDEDVNERIIETLSENFS